MDQFNFKIAVASAGSTETFKKVDGSEVAARYIISSGDGIAVVTGSGIDDTTKAGKAGWRVSMKVTRNNRITFFNGILVRVVVRKSDRSPERIGILTSKYGDYSVAVWERTDRRTGETLWSAQATAKTQQPTASPSPDGIDRANAALDEASMDEGDDYGY